MRRDHGLILTVLAVCALAFAPARGQDKAEAAGAPDKSTEILKEFRRFCADPDFRKRSEQMERLAEVDTVEAVKLLCSYGLKDENYRVRDRAVFALSKLQSPAAQAAILAGLKDQAESIRGNCALALARAASRPASALGELNALAVAEPKEEAKVSVIEALGKIGDKQSTPALLTIMASGNERVKIAAADSLALIRDPASTAPLIAMLKGNSWRNHIAAINALGAIRVKESIGPLIEFFKNSTGRPNDEAWHALQRITQMDFGDKGDKWGLWWADAESKFVVPPEGKPKAEKVSDDPYKRGPPKYHTIPVVSKKVLYVIDISASMLDPILVKDGRTDAKDQKFKSSPKIDIAREELAAVLRHLTKETTFNILAFETDLRPWKSQPRQASPENVQEAISWLEKQRPRIGGSGGGIKSASTTDENGWIPGRTNTYGALKYCFGLPTKPKQGGYTGSAPKTAGGCDTVYFLTDGEPTEGEVTNIEEILEDVKVWNKRGSLQINTIGMEQEGGLHTLLEGLATLTKGKCVFLGK